MEKIIPDYCIDNPIDCLFWERGINDNYQVRCADIRYSLRIYRHGIHTRDEIDFEVDALNYLHNNGFPVAFPIARRSGGYITEISTPEGVRYVLVTAFAEGDTAKFDSLDNLRLMGKSVANLHQVSDGFKTDHKKNFIDLKLLIDDSFKTIEPHVAHLPERLTLLKQYLETASNSVQQIGEDVLDFGFCHGDVHGGNTHLHDGVLRHFDFEECRFGYRVFDLATFKWSLALDGNGPESWAAFVTGYESVRKIGEAETELLDTFVLLRHIWLIGLHMRNADDFGGYLRSDEYIERQWKKLRVFTTEGIGAELKMENEYVVVVRAVPGGSAAKSEQITIDDRIVGVGDGEDGDFVDTVNASFDDVIDLIRGPKGSTVRLKILPANAPADSSPKVVALVRDKLEI